MISVSLDDRLGPKNADLDISGQPRPLRHNGYLAGRPAELLWLVTRYASEIAVGDRVLLVEEPRHEWRRRRRHRCPSRGLMATPLDLANGARIGPNPRFWGVSP
jgi:hypothetical protein